MKEVAVLAHIDHHLGQEKGDATLDFNGAMRENDEA